MRTPQELDHLRHQAVLLRRQGKSLRQIKAILGPMSNATLHDALRGEPPPEWTRRPNAKDGLRARARELRDQGLDYEEIAAALGVAKGSVSLWVRDLPVPERLSYAECRKRSARDHRGTSRPVLHAHAEAPQPEDRAEERRRGLSRLPSDRRPSRRRPLSQDRRMGGVEHGRILRRGSEADRRAIARRAVGRYRHEVPAGIVELRSTQCSITHRGDDPA